jgi:methylthioribose-1-phosphate isomerase
MTVRGAPAIGVAGAYGMAIAAASLADDSACDVDTFLVKMKEAKVYLDSSRPTAVNLEWATNRIVELATVFASRGCSVAQLQGIVLEEAHALAAEDLRINHSLGDFGAALLPSDKPVNVLHHCNTGSLATVGHGTALGVVYSAHEQKKQVHVWVDETRPRLQGAKLTCFELKQAGVPFHLIPDNAAGHLMYEDKVDVVLFGADRVAANGDVANKIGTMKVAVCAHEFGVPVYACVPTPTVDLGIPSGRDIVIELRDSTEVTHVGKEQITVDDCPVYNPAFDVTPAKYLTGIITEEGICYPPFSVSLKAAKERAEARVKANWEETIAKYAEKLGVAQ